MPPILRNRALLVLEHLEERLVLAGNILGTDGTNLFLYDQAGTTLSTRPYVAGPGGGGARGLSVDPSNNINVYSGTFTPDLATFNQGATTWSYQTLTGFSTVNNTSYGSVAAYNSYVFASDMSTAGAGSPNGMIRFDGGGSPVRFANGNDYIQVALGIDGWIYGVEGDTVDAYHPDSLVFSRTVNLTGGPDSDIRSVAVSATGTFVAATWSGYVVTYDASGAFIASIRPGGNLTSIALDTDGQVVVGSRFGQVYLTDINLSAPQTLPGTAAVFVTFDHYIGGAQLPAVVVRQTAGTNVAEGGATDTFSVVLTTLPTGPVEVTINPGTQLNVGPTVLTFTTTDWFTSQTVTVTAVDDAAVEGPHTGTISFTTSSADIDYNTAGVLNVTASITDNEVVIPPGVTIVDSGGSTNVAEGGTTDTYTVVLNAAPTANVTIGMSVSSQYTTAPTNLVFTTANWNVPQTVTVTAVDDALIEGAHTSPITHNATSSDLGYDGLAIARVTANIVDNDGAAVTITQTAGSTDVSESGSSDSYSVVLNAMPSADVVITVSPGSQLLASVPSLTFTPATWNVAQTVVVQPVDDAIAQGLHTQAIAHAASSSDSRYNGIAVASVTVNITDNDVAGVSFGATTIDINENSSANTYTVVLNTQPTANVIVTVTGDSQVTVGPSTLVFTPANWNVRQPVTVRAVDDALAEGLHNGLVTHSAGSVDTMYNGMALATVTARITDNENPGVLLSQSDRALSILEGSSRTYTAVLNSPPTADVVLNINPDGQVNVTPSSITFTPGDWNVPRPVVVTASDDGVEEGDHLGRITHTTTSGSTGFNNLTVAPVTANIVDNDGSAVFGTERADQVVVSFTPASIKVTVNGRVTTLDGTLTQLLLFAGDGNDSIQILAPTIPVVVNGGTGVDKVFVTGLAASNNFVLGDSSVSVNGQSVGVWQAEGLTVSGKAGNDTFTVQDVPAFPVELKGDVGTDSVVGPSRPNTWQITAANTGTLNNSVKLSAVENWTGGASNDSFVFGAGKTLSGRVDGGLGENTLDFTAASAAITVNLQTNVATGAKGFANIGAFVGGKGVADKLIAADRSNVWNVTSANAGNVNGTSFRNFENLAGGGLDDTFLLADGQGVKGKIDGGAGADVLDYSSYLSRPVTINLQGKTATNTGGFVNFEEFQGGSGTADMLVGANKVNLWNVNGTGSGDVGGALFGNFENLTGGTLTDNFALDSGGDWFGTLNGGTGADTLTAFPGQANVWLPAGLNAGTLNGRKYAGIEVRR